MGLNAMVFPFCCGLGTKKPDRFGSGYLVLIGLIRSGCFLSGGLVCGWILHYPPGFRIPERIGQDGFHKAGHRNFPTDPLMVENTDKLATDGRRVVTESGHLFGFEVDFGNVPRSLHYIVGGKRGEMPLPGGDMPSYTASAICCISAAGGGVGR